MLVYDQFEGDDTALALRQHTVASAALTTIVAVCERHYHHACAIARVPADRWPTDDRDIDLSALQAANEVLAAAWRWDVAPPQPRLALAGPPRAYDMADWLHWLRAEVGTWHAEPDLVLGVVDVVSGEGDAAAARLAAALRMRHAAIPWHDHLLGSSD